MRELTANHSGWKQGAAIAAGIAAGVVIVTCSTAALAQGAPPPPTPTTVPQASSAGPQTLPGGATQIQETFGDWRVTCLSPNGTKVCAMSQQLADQNTRQLVIGMELKALNAGKTEGTLVLPFGLAVDKPVTLQIDEQSAVMTNKVRTCLQIGCVVSLSLEPQTVTALRNGTILHVKATADGGTEAAWRMSLKGFAGALDRTTTLSK